MILLRMETEDLDTTEVQDVPPAVAMVMSALDAGKPDMDERRELGRISYRTTTRLRLFRDQPTTAPWRLYTRDINRRGLGFITPHRLPLGYGGVVMLRDDNGQMVNVHCTLSRCREASPGWFEGSLNFNREQPQFDF